MYGDKHFHDLRKIENAFKKVKKATNWHINKHNSLDILTYF